MAGPAVGWKDGVGWVDASGAPTGAPKTQEDIRAIMGDAPPVGWKDGVGFVDKDGRPTGNWAQGEQFEQMVNKTAEQAPPVNLEVGWGNTAGTRLGAESTSYRRGIDDTPWGNIAQPSAYQYGGAPGVARAEAERYGGLAQASDNRAAPNLSSSPFGAQYANDRGLDQGSRGSQLYGLGQLQGLIEGRGPSVAQQQQYAGLAQAMQQQAAIAASARGGGANLAFAQQQAAQNAANMSGSAIQQNAILRAQEQMGAINNYGGLAQAMRAQDQARAAQSAQLAGQQAAIDMQSRQTNDSRNLAYEQMRRGVFQDQMGARQAGEAMNAGIYQQNQDRQQRADMAAAEERGRIISGATSAAGAVIGSMVAPGPGTAAGAAVGKVAGDTAAAKSDVRAKKNIGDGATAVRATMREASPYEFDYKNPGRDGEGRRIGVMAQDLERGPLGKQVVKTGSDGQKVIDGPRGLGLALASSADQEKRLQRLEALSKANQGSDPISQAAIARSVLPGTLHYEALAKAQRETELNELDRAARHEAARSLQLADERRARDAEERLASEMRMREALKPRAQPQASGYPALAMAGR